LTQYLLQLILFVIHWPYLSRPQSSPGSLREPCRRLSEEDNDNDWVAFAVWTTTEPPYDGRSTSASLAANRESKGARRSVPKDAAAERASHPQIIRVQAP
jgi:hypothetical protein